MRAATTSRSTGGKKKAGSKKKGARKSRAKGGTVRGPRSTPLDMLHGEEAKKLLVMLIDRHPELRRDSDELATAILGDVDAETLRKELGQCLRGLDMTELAAYSGRQPWGEYVEPNEAAHRVLDELMQPYLDDLGRRIELGLEDAARSLCLGIVLALYDARGSGSDSLLAYAPDYCENEAAYAVEILAKKSSRLHRRRWKLPDGSESLLPEWDGLFSRVR